MHLLLSLVVLALWDSAVGQRPLGQLRAQQQAGGNGGDKDVQDILNTPADQVPDIRTVIQQHINKKNKEDLRENVKRASRECKQIIARNSGALSKGCVPALDNAIKNAPLRRDVFDTLQGIFFNAMETSNGPQCKPKFQNYLRELQQQNCAKEAQELNENLDRLELLRRFQQLNIPTEGPEASALLREANDKGCIAQRQQVGRAILGQLSQNCPRLSNILSKWLIQEAADNRV